MIKDIIQQKESTSPNNKRLAVLKEHFPACFKANDVFGKIVTAGFVL